MHRLQLPRMATFVHSGEFQAFVGNGNCGTFEMVVNCRGLVTVICLFVCLFIYLFVCLFVVLVIDRQHSLRQTSNMSNEII
jgi:hypothetical protein